jgi:hypothetical protein
VAAADTAVEASCRSHAGGSGDGGGPGRGGDGRALGTAAAWVAPTSTASRARVAGPLKMHTQKTQDLVITVSDGETGAVSQGRRDAGSRDQPCKPKAKWAHCRCSFPYSW